MSTTENGSLHSLAFLYLTFGHATDGALTIEEMRTLGTQLRAWAPEADLAEVGDTIKAAAAEYKSMADLPAKLARAREATAVLKASATPEERARIIADLQSIAGADGEVSALEQAFIDGMARDFAK